MDLIFGCVVPSNAARLMVVLGFSLQCRSFCVDNHEALHHRIMAEAKREPMHLSEKDRNH